MPRNLYLVALAILGAVVVTSGANADEPTDFLTTVLTSYKNGATNWETQLQNYAKSLFWLLATIEIAYGGIKLVVRGADFAEWASELVNQILFIGFFAALLQNSVGENSWASLIVKSFTTAAGAASGSGSGDQTSVPTTIFKTGLALATTITNLPSELSIGTYLVHWISALVIVFCFALMAAAYIAALVESYVVISAGVLFMGFGGSRFTKDYALKILIYAVSVGAKLFIIQLLVGLAQQLFMQLNTNLSTNSNTTDIFMAIGTGLVFLMLVRTIPEIVQGLLNGVHVGGGAAVLTGAAGTAAGTAAGAAMGFGKGLGGAAMAVRDAYKLASSQVASGSGFGAKTGQAARNLAVAAGETIGNRLSGEQHSGTFGGQTARNLKDKTPPKEKS